MHETPNGWDKEYYGIRLLHEEALLLETILPRLFGYHLLMVGDPMFAHFTHSSLIQHRILINRTEGFAEKCQIVRGNYNQLPIATEAMDVVLLPHIEKISEPEDVIQDVVRTLRPNGYLIITGANPTTWVGAKHAAQRFLFHPKQPHDVWPTLSQTSAWLKASSLAIRQESFFCNISPKHERFVGSITKKTKHPLSFIAGGYMIVAIKKEASMIPLRARWHRKHHVWVNDEVPTN